MLQTLLNQGMQINGVFFRLNENLARYLKNRAENTKNNAFHQIFP